MGVDERTGGSIERIAKRFGHSDVWARVLLDLTKLGPGTLKAILTGTLPPTVTLKDLHHASKHLDWSIQAAALRG